MGIRRLGWELDWRKFIVYLRDKYDVHKVFVFIGYIEHNIEFYNFLRRCGYIIIFKPVQHTPAGNIKGNCDADMVAYIMSRRNCYHQAVVITSDGDFYLTIRMLRHAYKLRAVISPDKKRCSKILKQEAGDFIDYITYLKHKLERL